MGNKCGNVITKTIRQTMKLIPLTKIKDADEFYRGTRFRLYNVGLNVKSKKEDYYEYMLTENPSDNEYMLLTHVEGYKAGATLALVKIKKSKTKVVVTGKAIKFSIGTENTFLLKDKNTEVDK